MTEESSDSHLPEPVIKCGRFYHPWEFKKPQFLDVMKWLITEKNYSSVPSNQQELDQTLPIVKFDTAEVEQTTGDGEVRVTWLGHATVLVQFDGINVLTDPAFSERLTPAHIPFGVRRFRNCPCTVDQLPNIDAVVISHNHYDHLDYKSVCDLNRRFRDRLTWYVPAGLGSWMTSTGCSNVVELSWWKEAKLVGKPHTFVSVPAQHWSKRGIADDNKTLWCGWCIIGPTCRFYFAGDTGYKDSVFKLIGDKYGPFDLAAIPIGAYCPRWFMRSQHVDPNEAFQIHKDIRAFNSLGIHWGTFQLAYEHYLEPPKVIEELQAQQPKEEGRLGFYTTFIGVSKLLKGWSKASVQ